MFCPALNYLEATVRSFQASVFNMMSMLSEDLSVLSPQQESQTVGGNASSCM